jgi:dipeptidase D
MKTLDLFKEITQVPRPTFHEEKIRAFLIERASSLGYSHTTDAVGNVLIRVAGAGSSASSPTIALQGHMDMVCEKAPGVEIDFLTDPLNIYEENGYLKARGTTLGADNGVGVALAFYCASLADHPPLEIVLTVDEEVSMTGADKMQPGFFSAKRLINLDSGSIKVITAGSAGGDDGFITLGLEPLQGYRASARLSLELEGLKGGHSGGNIGLGRLVATKVMADLLEQYTQLGFDFRVEDMQIGAAANALARDAKVSLLFNKAEQASAAAKVSCRLQSGDGESLKIVAGIETFAVAEHNCMSLAKQVELISLMNNLLHGVIEWQEEASKLPRTSANLASVKLLNVDGAMCIKIAVSYRSFDNAMLPIMKERISTIVASTSATMSHGGAYPAWPPKKESVLRTLCAKVYQDVLGSEPVVVARHVGLECGYWERLSPGIDVVSIGPNLFDLHSPTERVEIATIESMERWLTALMKEL